MLGISIIVGVLVVPYLVMNVRRLRRGKGWAVTYCHVLMEADREAQARRRAAAHQTYPLSTASISERSTGPKRTIQPLSRS